MFKFICEYCGQEFERKQNKHQRFCSNKCRALSLKPNFLDNNNHPSNFNSNKIRYCKICGIKLHHCNTTGYCNNHYRDYSDYKLHLSNTQKEKGIGGYKFGSGGGKKGKYDGILFDSSWELAFYIYYKEHNLYIERCKEKRKYIYNNKEYFYIPDFITNDGIIEIKGYDTDRSISKSIQNPDIKVLHKNDLIDILNYIINKYGDKFYNKFYNSGVAQ